MYQKGYVREEFNSHRLTYCQSMQIRISPYVFYSMCESDSICGVHKPVIIYEIKKFK